MSNIKELFLKLTEYTIPHGYEKTLEHLLPAGFKKDSIGNYYYEIGNSETLFTTHLDTYSDKYEKVVHKFYNADSKPCSKESAVFVATDGKTILGGDNKAGCTILINMINNGIAGVYYFFLGEEPIISGGVWGSTQALRANPEYFKKFKRAIAFDRRETGSVITRQMARKCCSDEFTNAIIAEMSKNGLDFHNDPTGYYTDSGVFMDVIPECTNLSAGVWNEHSPKEYCYLDYLEMVANAALHINWETLPTVRKAFKNVPEKKQHFATKMFDMDKTIETFEIVDQLLSEYGFLCINSEDFIPDHEMVFSQWHDDVEISLKFKNDKIVYDGNELSIKDFMDSFENQ
jgi:hypothetical protein